MNIIATLPAGITEITVNGLHQWDYGRKLEIRSPDLPALIEVHFACAGMNEAVVRSCSVTLGVAVAAIPDRCLEKSTPITAWVYALDGTSGVTVAKINLIIEPRTRPCPSREIPTDLSDKYTEAVTAMNHVVEEISAGNVTTARAIADGDGNKIPDTYATKAEVINGETLSTNLCAKVEEIIATHPRRTYLFMLRSSYTGDDLPATASKASYAVVYAQYDTALVYLLDCSPNRSIFYRRYREKDGWAEWIEMIDSSNIGAYLGSMTAKRAQYMQVSLKVELVNKLGDGVLADLTYYKDGVATTEAFDSLDGEGSPSSSLFITADLGSYLILSSNKVTSSVKYKVEDTPLVEKGKYGSGGNYEYKNRFMVIGGGTAVFTFSAT